MAIKARSLHEQKGQASGIDEYRTYNAATTSLPRAQRLTIALILSGARASGHVFEICFRKNPEQHGKHKERQKSGRHQPPDDDTR